MKEKTKIQMLVWGIKHIAKNHGFHASTDYKEDGEVCIWGGCNVPTLADVHFLCEDLGIEKCNIESNECGIDVWISDEWLSENGKKPYVKGVESWKKN